MKYLTLTGSPRSNFGQEFGQLFEDFWAAPAYAQFGSETWDPITEVEEEDGHFLLTLEVPGMKREDLKIEALGSKLTISGERKGDSKRRATKFQKAFTVPADVDIGKIEASCEDGVLKVFVPKPEVAKPKEIRISDSSVSSGLFAKLLKDEKSA